MEGDDSNDSEKDVESRAKSFTALAEKAMLFETDADYDFY